MANASHLNLCGRMRLRNGFEIYPGPTFALAACPECVCAYVHAAAQEAGIDINQYIECAVDQALEGHTLYYAYHILMAQVSHLDIVCVCVRP